MTMIAHHRPYMPTDTSKIAELSQHGHRARGLALRDAVKSVFKNRAVTRRAPMPLAKNVLKAG